MELLMKGIVVLVTMVYGFKATVFYVGGVLCQNGYKKDTIRENIVSVPVAVYADNVPRSIASVSILIIYTNLIWLGSMEGFSLVNELWWMFLVIALHNCNHDFGYRYVGLEDVAMICQGELQSLVVTKGTLHPGWVDLVGIQCVGRAKGNTNVASIHAVRVRVKRTKEVIDISGIRGFIHLHKNKLKVKLI